VQGLLSLGLSDWMKTERIKTVRSINPQEKREIFSRQTENIKFIVRDFSTKQIAEVLFLSEKTVETHRKSILRKTDCASLVRLVNYAHANQLV
jgi:two-component system, NarL family, nitrate/nitrite response regulator NarL